MSDTMSDAAVATRQPGAVPDVEPANREPHRVYAGTMWNAMAGDPQFTFPRRPRVVPGLVTVELEDGLVVHGGPERRVFRGTVAKALLPSLLAALDGRRDLTAVAQRLGLDGPDDVAAAVALLYTSGLLEEGDDDTPAGESGSSRAAVARYLDTTRAWPNAASAFRGLAARPAAVLETGTSARAFREVLAECGDVVRAMQPSEPVLGNELVVVVCDDEEDTAHLARLDRECAAVGGRWLLVTYSDGVLRLGPRFDRRHTACYRCYREAADAEAPRSPRGSVVPQELWVAVAAGEVFNSRVRIGTATTFSGVTTLDLEDWTTTSQVVVRRPGCPDCGHPEAGGAAATTAFAYEQSAAFPPRDLLDPKGHQAHYKVGNIVIQRDHRTYESAPRVELPDLATWPPLTVRNGRWNLDVLAVCLRAAFGLKPQQDAVQVRRYPPTGGNLGSPQAFVLAADVDGLAPGVYYYEPFLHALSVLGGPAELATAGTAVLDDDGAQGWVVVSAALRRVAHKYHGLAPRICLLDAGVARAQLVELAREQGLSTGPVDRWDDDRLADSLGLSRADDPVTTIIRCASGGATQPAQPEREE